jgi:hypothetical protein
MSARQQQIGRGVVVSRRDEAEVEPLQAGRREQIGDRFVEERDPLVDIRRRRPPCARQTGQWRHRTRPPTGILS